MSEQRVARLEAENRHLREALVLALALRFIDPEQHDVIEESR